VSGRISAHIRSNVVNYLALFFALGGTAYALDGSNTVFSDDIVDGEVKAEDIKSANLTTVDLGTGAVATDALPDRAVIRRNLGAGGISSGQIAGGAVPTGKLADGAVTEPKLGCEGNSPDDVMVKVGSVCMDRYEASIWDAPTGGNQITGEIPCQPNGQDCTNIYARSVAGVIPAAQLTWHQAQQALANSGKQLPTNAEWQMAAAGTPVVGQSDNPDLSDCNVSASVLEPTGANPGCVSNWGVNDMVGNLGEWVGEWDEKSFTNAIWPPGTGDTSSIGRASGEPSLRFPGALARGGDFHDGRKAGPFKVGAAHQPWRGAPVIGFRGVR
jgi:formylglycine-generating enzyme required for sulfatase activity